MKATSSVPTLFLVRVLSISSKQLWQPALDMNQRFMDEAVFYTHTTVASSHQEWLGISRQEAVLRRNHVEDCQQVLEPS